MAGISLADFVQKYNGKKIDFDGLYGAQCVDLFRLYCKEGLGIKEHTGSCSTSGGAKDLFLDYEKMQGERKYFSKVTGKNFNAGDVLVWDGTDKNKFGHVAIFLCKLNNLLLVFEQDGFKQNGAQINIRCTDNLLGALRKK